METLASGTAAPANAESTAQAEAPEADAKGTEANGDGSAPSVPEADTSAPKVKEDPVQKRIDQLTREKYDALRERDRQSYELERLNARLAEVEKAKQPEVAPQNDFPTLEQFGYDEGKFNAAVATHYAKLASEQARTAAQEQLRAEREQQSREQANKNWKTKEAEFLKSKPDYAQKVYRDPRDGGPIVTPHMGEVMMASEHGPAIAYHLAENVEAAAAIAQLPPLEQARELGRIEERLVAARAPAKPAVSQAPPPPAKVDATEAPSNFKVDTADSDQLSDAEWTRRRNAQEQARLRKARG